MYRIWLSRADTPQHPPPRPTLPHPAPLSRGSASRITAAEQTCRSLPPASMQDASDPRGGAIAFALIYFTFFLDNVLLTVLVPIIPDWVRGSSLALWRGQGAPLASVLNHTVAAAEGEAGGAQALLGAVLGAKAAAQLLTAPLAGAAVCRRGAAPVLRAGTAALAAAAGVFAGVSGRRGWRAALAVALGRAAHGAGAALAGVAGLALAARALPPHQRDRAIGALLGAVALGVLVGYACGGAAAALWSRAAPFTLLAGALLANLGAYPPRRHHAATTPRAEPRLITPLFQACSTCSSTRTSTTARARAAAACRGAAWRRWRGAARRARARAPCCSPRASWRRWSPACRCGWSTSSTRSAGWRARCSCPTAPATCWPPACWAARRGGWAPSAWRWRASWRWLWRRWPCLTPPPCARWRCRTWRWARGWARRTRRWCRRCWRGTPGARRTPPRCCRRPPAPRTRWARCWAARRRGAWASRPPCARWACSTCCTCARCTARCADTRSRSSGAPSSWTKTATRRTRRSRRRGRRRGHDSPLLLPP
nr:uncharacterized protein LOC126056609 isoform X2 [Helicoverpa armigera]